MNQIKLLYPVFLAAVLSGCLEHRYAITALPENKFQLNYELRGDRVDMDDGNELLPDSTVWLTERSIEESEDETTHILTGSLQVLGIKSLPSALDWQKELRDSIYFRPVFDIKSTWYPFGSRSDITIRLLSRRFNELYGDIWDFVPEECRILDNDDELNAVPADEIKMLERKFGLGIIQWNRSRYELVFDRVWAVCKERNLLISDENKTGYSVSRAGWVDDLHIYLNSLDVGEPQTANLVWWKDVREAFLNRFSHLIKANNLDTVADIADNVETNYLISKDLEDDRFVFTWTTPGIFLATNGIKNDRTINWEVDGKDISNEEIILTASIIRFDTAQLVGALLIVLVGIFIIIRRRRTSKHTNNNEL